MGGRGGFGTRPASLLFGRWIQGWGHRQIGHDLYGREEHLLQITDADQGKTGIMNLGTEGSTHHTNTACLISWKQATSFSCSSLPSQYARRHRVRWRQCWTPLTLPPCALQHAPSCPPLRCSRSTVSLSCLRRKTLTCKTCTSRHAKSQAAEKSPKNTLSAPHLPLSHPVLTTMHFPPLPESDVPTYDVGPLFPRLGIASPREPREVVNYSVGPVL